MSLHDAVHAILAEVPNPAPAATSRSRCCPARPSGSDDVAVFWDTAFGVQARVETA